MESHYFDCQCRDYEHTLRFTFDEEDGDLTAEVYLADWPLIVSFGQRSFYLPRFFRRAVVAFRYLFGMKQKYGAWGSWLLRPEDHDGIIALLEKAKHVKMTHTERENRLD